MIDIKGLFYRAVAPMSVQAAESRWREINARKRAAGCQCGSPATHVRRIHGNTGSVPAEVWSCAEHFGVESWSGVQVAEPGGARTVWTPEWGRSSPCSTCSGRCSRSGPIGGPPNRWYCPAGPETGDGP